MKRSEINTVIKRFEDLLSEYRFAMPPFASFTPEEWPNVGHEWDEVRDNMLGWDITDFGMNDYDNYGFALFTVRNGNQKDDRYTKPYAEKLLMVDGGQTVAMHYHWQKTEDIINRGGNDLFITVYNGTENGDRLDTDVTLSTDGKKQTVPAGTKIHLKPGESITITPYMYHDFYVPEGHGCLIGEVSSSNDDDNDNRFYEPVGRFPKIEEDEPPYRLMCNEYPAAKD